MNDIKDLLVPILKENDIINNYKVDTATAKTTPKRGDIWISSSNSDDSNFEKNIVALIEVKHKNSNIDDADWLEGMKHGKLKASLQGLNYYIVSNCTEFRFYNVYDDTLLCLDNNPITKMVNIEILNKINTQVSENNSEVYHKEIIDYPEIQETEFRTTLNKLSDTYRSVGIQKDERIDPTISFVILKYIAEKETEDRTLPNKIKLWQDLEDIKENGDLKAEFNTIVTQIWYDEEFKDEDNIYKDFKDLIKFPPKLKNDNYVDIYDEFSNYHFHGARFDLFGVIYEEFASTNKKKEFGEFYTRRHITNSVSKLLLGYELNPRPLKICDPACGTGGFLTEGYKVLYSNYQRNNKLQPSTKDELKTNVFYGFDNEEKSIARTKLNMFLAGDGHTNIHEIDDSLLDWRPNNGWNENSFDYIMTNPPMGAYKGSANIDEFKFTNSKRYELLFLEKVIKATKPSGEIAIVMNDGTLESPSHENARIELLKYCNIKAIVSLTKFAFAPYTKEKTYVLFLQKKDNGNLEKQEFPIWSYILDYDGYANSDKRYKTDRHNDIPELENLFFDAINLSQKYLSNKSAFESEKLKFERDVNDKEKKDGLYGKKCGYIYPDEINEDNFHNLLSEFHLRPIKVNHISKDEYISELNAMQETIKQLIIDFNEL